MPAFHESLEMLCSYLKVVGYLYILGAATDWCLSSVESVMRWHLVETTESLGVIARQLARNLMT
jgi:hypothetical protein